MSPFVDITGPRFRHLSPPGILLDVSRPIRGQHAQDFFHVRIFVRLLPEENVYQTIGVWQPAAFPALERKSAGEPEHPDALPRAVESFRVSIEPLNHIRVCLLCERDASLAIAATYMDDHSTGRPASREQVIQCRFSDVDPLVVVSMFRRAGCPGGGEKQTGNQGKDMDANGKPASHGNFSKLLRL
jgi:hypothetical protein